MDSRQAFCHACNLTFRVPTVNTQNEGLRCVRCQSEFVEFVTEPTTSPDLFTEIRRRESLPRGEPIDRIPGAPVVVFPEASVSFRLGSPGEHADNVFEEAFRLLGPFGRNGRFGTTTANAFPNQRSEYGGALERLVDQLSQLHQPARVPASTTALRSLKRERVGDQNRNLIGESCVVCHDQYKQNDTVVTLPCGHVFHEDCVMPWFNDHNTCPVCRYALPTSSQDNHPLSPFRQVENQTHNQEDSTQSPPNIDSLFGLFRGSTESPSHDRPGRLRSPGVGSGRQTTFDNHLSFVLHEQSQQDHAHDNRNQTRQSMETERERHLRESIISAQDQLRSLDHRLTEQLDEHRRLQDQIQHLQDQRQILRQRFSSFQNQGINAVNRLEAFIDNHHQHQQEPDSEDGVFTRLNQVAGRLRNILNRNPSGVDDSSHYSSSNSSGNYER
eukprot:g1208.t1